MDKKITWKKKRSPRKWGMVPRLITDANIERARKIEKKVAKALKFGTVTLSPDLEERLLQDVEAFTYKQAQLDHIPDGRELQELVQNLKNSAKAFRLSLEDIQHPRIMGTIPLPIEMKTYQSIKDLMETVKTWEQAAAMAMPKLRKGPGPDAFVLELIFQLIEIYEAATGKKAAPGYYYRLENQIRGEFPNFVAGILDALGPPAVYQGSRALVETLIPNALSLLKDDERNDA